MPCRRFTIHVDTGEYLDDGGAATISATIFMPSDKRAKAAILCCFPGGGMSQLYFSLKDASFTSAMTARGFITVTLDHPGIGESSRPADLFELTARRIADMEVHAVQAIAADLRAGSVHHGRQPVPEFVMIGVGHSLGAMLVALQQAAGRPYAALALLGFSTRGLPEVLTAEERQHAKCTIRDDAYYAALARRRFGNSGLAAIPGRPNGSAALKAASAPLLTVAAIQSMLPDNITAEAATIDVPLLLAVGDRDITGHADAIARRFAAARDVRLLVLENTGHHPFIAASAVRLYDDLAAWADAIALAA